MSKPSWKLFPALLLALGLALPSFPAAAQDVAPAGQSAVDDDDDDDGDEGLWGLLGLLGLIGLAGLRRRDHRHDHVVHGTTTTTGTVRDPNRP